MSDDRPQFHYILSGIDHSNWVLTATRDGGGVHLTRHGEDPLDDDLQLWQLVPDNRIANYCYIVNPFLKKVIRRVGGGENWCGVELAPVSEVAADPNVLWERPPDNQFAPVHAFLAHLPMGLPDIYANLNVAGDGPYDESSGIIGYLKYGGESNSQWQCVPDTTQLVPTSIDYDLSKAVIDLNVPPTDCEALGVDNRASSFPLTETIKLTRVRTSTKTTSYSQADQHSLQIADTLSVKLIWKDVAELSNSTTVTVSNSSTVTIGDQESETTTDTDEVDATIQVPAKKGIRCFVRVNRGKVTVPYVAHIERVLPVAGNPTREYEISGVFTNVNAVDYSIMAEDVQSQQRVVIVENAPFDAAPLQAQPFPSQ